MKKLSRKLKEKAPGSLIQALLNDCSTSYDALETAHFRWAESMENPANTMNSSTDFVDIADARSWLDAVDLVYEPLISEATEYLAVDSTEDPSTLDSVLPPSGDTSDAVSTADEKTVTTDATEVQFTLSAASVERLRPPKISCMVFGSNPREWKLFACEFNTNVKAYYPDNERKLVSLLFKFTSHKAKSCVRSHVVSNSKTPFTDAWSELLSLFGTPAILAKYIISDLKNGPSVSSSNDFLEFDREIQHAINQLSRTSHESDILGHSIINDLLIRLPSSVHVRWNKLALKYKVAHDAYPDIFEFSKFIKLLAAESHDEYYGLDATKRRYLKSVCKQRESKKPCDVMSSSTFIQEVQSAAVESSLGRGSNTKRSFPPNCKFCNEQRHALTSCPTFLALEHAGRWGDDLIASKVCWKCLSYCGSPVNCSPVSDCNCGMPFHYLLHPPPCPAQISQVPNQNDAGFVQTSTGFTALPVLEVVVGNVLTYALQDSGSTASYITQDLVDKLKLDSAPSKNFTRTINATTDTNHRIVKSVKIRGKGQSVYRTITNVFVCQQIPATTRRVALCVKQFPYLDGIDLSAQRAESVGMLVGADSGLNRPTDYKSHPEFPDNNPYAVKYPLGWAISGPIDGGKILKRDTNDVLLIECHQRSHTDRLSRIEDDIRKLYEIERGDLGKAWSITDKKVFQFWEDNITKDDQGHYVLPIPFHDVERRIPNNREYTLKRLFSLKRKLINTGIYDRYDAQLRSMIEDGFIEPVPSKLLGRDDGRVWYLPHFDVIRPDKPGKIRIVMDAKSEYEGVSLNKLCYQGPDLCNKLFSILMRFRQYYAAWSADVTAMYLQVRVPLEQRDMMRILWFKNGVVEELRMTSHIFGGVWCAASSTFALRRAVIDAKASAEVADVVNREFYVDDVLRSVAAVMDECREPADVRDALIGGKFSLVKFQASHPELLKDIAKEHLAPPLKTIRDEDHTKALGLHWNMATDCFYYDADVLRDLSVDTKRTLLSANSTLFDPPGCIAPLLVPPKRIFQKVVGLKLGWDDPLPPEIIEEWKTWYTGLKNLKNLHFPRAMLRADTDGATVELHHFCDASETAYGCAAYVRVVYPDGDIDVNLLCAKGRVAPISHVTIPRLELIAAHLTTRLNVSLLDDLTMKFSAVHFWCDSTITLHYIRNPSLRLQTFVANRVSYIHQNTEVSQWHHVRTDLNIADIISRGIMSVDDLPRQWIKGPDFLHLPEAEWPVEVELPVPAVPMELKVNATCVTPHPPNPENDNSTSQKCTETQAHPVDTLISHFSSAYRLFIAVSWLKRVCRRAKNKTLELGPITATEMNVAEEFCVRHVQSSCYEREIQDLSNPDEDDIVQVNAKSQLRSLSPTILDGLLRVGGRLRYADPQLLNRHPIILPRNHPLSLLLLLRAHEKAHLGTEWTISMLREKYWIIGARLSLRKLRAKCAYCHRNFSQPTPQKMADLPAVRCELVQFAFTNTGVDLFGPFYVKHGRGQAKRWVTLFTCLSIRAIHLEVVHSMSADSFVMALQRFAARRGLPTHMRSDRGTNIVGAESELTAAWNEIDTDEITVKARRKGIDWKFNPPKASEMGGVWERQIATVRKCVTGILNPKVALDDEVLYTTLCEAENLVNSRPITRVSPDPEDGALTPNHLLMMKSNNTEDHIEFNLGAIYRRNWKKVCMLKDQFWNKWVKEYLAELQSRKVWDKERQNFKPDDLVLMVDPLNPRATWPLARITKINTDGDGLVRDVELRTGNSSYTRPVTKLVKLELD